MHLLYAFNAGLIASSAFEPIAFWPASIFGIASLFYLNNLPSPKNLRTRLLINFLFGIGFQVHTLYWIGTYVGTIAWVSLVIMQATFFLVLSFGRTPIQFTVSWIAFEFILRTFPFGGFGWNRIGFAFTETSLNPLYPIVGITGIAFVVVLISAYLASACYKQILGTLLILVILAQIPFELQSVGSTKVALVQGGQTEKLDNTFENAENALERHFQATKSIAPDSADLVIWPENAIAHDPSVRKSTNERLEFERNRIHTEILVNGNLTDGTNGSVLLGNNKIQTYSKRYLTPFGEFIPFQSLIEKISDKAEKVIPYIPGTEDILFKSNSGKFRVLICYELLSDDLARNEMKDAEFLVVQTNNATYFGTWQLDQELAIAKARSAENAKFAAYVSTTGGTSIINNQGKVIGSINKYENKVLLGTIEKFDGGTPANKYGSWLEIMILLLVPVFLLRKKSRL